MFAVNINIYTPDWSGHVRSTQKRTVSQWGVSVTAGDIDEDKGERDSLIDYNRPDW